MRLIRFRLVSRSPRMVWLAVALIALSSLPASAKDSDTTNAGSAHNETGYSRDSVYASIDGADINAFNFNFVTQFPLAVGLSYPENAGVQLQLNLTYNSRVAYWHKSDLHRKFLRTRRQNPFGLGFDLVLLSENQSGFRFEIGG
jgi:hypothetical protein